MKKYFISLVILLITDQLSKYWAYQSLGFVSQEITPFLSFTFAQNYGAAFSFLADSGGWQRYFLSAISAIAAVVISVWMLKTPLKFRLKLSSLTLILSGAIGNMIDRVFQGFVIDFIDVHYASFNFPIFNLADSFIFIGVILLLITDWKK